MADVTTRYKPYSLSGEPTAYMVEQIDAMFGLLFNDLEAVETGKLLSASISDVNTGDPERGALIVGSDDDPSNWEVFTIGVTGSVLVSNGLDPSWSVQPLFLDLTNNLVGINTTTPLFPLHVVGDSYEQIYATSTGTVGAGIQLQPTGSNEWSVIATGATAGQGDNRLLFFYNSTTNAGVFDGVNNRFGLRTVSPSVPLHVQESDAGTEPTWSAADVVLIESSNASGAALNFFTPATRAAAIVFSDTVRNRGNLVYDHATDAMSMATAASARIVITSGGQVGLGSGIASTDIPAEPRLHVRKGNAGTDPSWVAGDVILVENTAATDAWVNIFGTAGVGIVFSDTTRNMGAVFYDHSNDSLGFRVNSATRFTITSAGLFNFATDSGIGVIDTNASHYMRLDCGSDLSADRVLSFVPGDAARTITVNGNPTLDDWFDQSVKTTATPTFGATTITGALTISGASAGQIVFPATQNASANANTLDDYEEGTWTPVIGGDGGTSGQTYSVQQAHYIKVGRKVHVSWEATLSAKGTITGSVVISGLPFSVQFSDNVPTILWSSTNTAFVNVQGQAVAGATQVYVLVATAAATGQSAIATADVTNTTSFIGRMTYTHSS